MLTHTNPPLPPFPWLVPSEPALSNTYPASRPTRQSRRTRRVQAGVGAAFAVLCGGTAVFLLWPSPHPVPAVNVLGTAPAAVAAIAPAPLETRGADRAVLIAPPPAPMREAAPSARMTKGASRTPLSEPATGAPPAFEQSTATDAAPVVVPPEPPLAETPASAATIAQFRSVMEESRDAARLVIRLASRERPPRDASAEALTAYRLRQQNADAARDYRRYLDRLARSMRGSPSQAESRQLLERAQQTQDYLAAMLADSQASLR